MAMTNVLIYTNFKTNKRCWP